MLGWALTFLILAILAGLLGFVALAGLAAWIAKILFLIFLVLAGGQFSSCAPCEDARWSEPGGGRLARPRPHCTPMTARPSICARAWLIIGLASIAATPRPALAQPPASAPARTSSPTAAQLTGARLKDAKGATVGQIEKVIADSAGRPRQVLVRITRVRRTLPVERPDPRATPMSALTAPSLRPCRRPIDPPQTHGGFFCPPTPRPGTEFVQMGLLFAEAATPPRLQAGQGWPAASAPHVDNCGGIGQNRFAALCVLVGLSSQCFETDKHVGALAARRRGRRAPAATRPKAGAGRPARSRATATCSARWRDSSRPASAGPL